MPDSPEKSAPKWHHPKDVLKLHQLKRKKKALQERINGKSPQQSTESNKRKNPFGITTECKRSRPDIAEESSDQTLFKLFNQTPQNGNNSFTSFSNLLNQINEKPEHVEVVKAKGEKWLPIDWSLKTKARLLSAKPFPWNSKLKVVEEASGITAFTRCLDNNSETKLDTSPNAKFYQCCLYWQQPVLPWLQLFPRNNKNRTGNSFVTNAEIRNSLHYSWTDSFRSLFQLIRTRQCPFFYICANSFTVLFRAAGICGYTDINALITPTTRGFRALLKQEEIEFTMPLKKKAETEEKHNNDDDEEEVMDDWLKRMGCNSDDIKQINYSQLKTAQKDESEVDNSEQSLILIEGVEVHSLYNFLLNCKTITANIGPLAGIPPTLLSPIAFHGASLNSLKIRENKVHIDNVDYYSLELNGPILPTTIHNLFAINSPEHELTASFCSFQPTDAFSKMIKDNSNEMPVSVVFGKENLSDCGLNKRVLQQFCSPDTKIVTNIECLKYTDDKTFTWS